MQSIFWCSSETQGSLLISKKNSQVLIPFSCT